MLVMPHISNKKYCNICRIEIRFLKKIYSKRKYKLANAKEDSLL